MAKRPTVTGRSGGEARHVRLHHWMMACAAWRGLSGDARALYVEIAGRYNGSNNGRIHFSLREALAALPVGKTTAHRAMKSLEERGFIVAVKRGHFDRKLRHSTEWRLTEFGCDATGSLPSKDFMRWRPEGF